MRCLSRHDPLGFRNTLAYEIPLSNCSPCAGHRKAGSAASLTRSPYHSPAICLLPPASSPAHPLKAVELRQLRPCLPSLPGCALPPALPEGSEQRSLSARVICQPSYLAATRAGCTLLLLPWEIDAEGLLSVTVSSRLCFCTAWKQRRFLLLLFFEVQGNICKAPNNWLPF